MGRGISSDRPPSQKLSKRTQWTLLAILLLLATAARFYMPPGFGFHDDEYLAMELIRGKGPEHFDLKQNVLLESPANFTDFSDRAPIWKIWTSLNRDAHPPLYFIVLRFFREALGPGEWVLRLPSQLAGLMSVVLIFLIGRELFGPAAGLWAAALLAASGTQIQYAQEVRNYALLEALVLAATLALVRMQTRGPTASRMIAMGLCLLGAALTHYFAVAAFAGMAVYALLMLRGRARIGAIAVFAVAMSLYLGCWGHWIWAQHFGFAEKNAWMFDGGPGHLKRTMQRLGTVALRFFCNPDLLPYARSPIWMYLPAALWLLPQVLLLWKQKPDETNTWRGGVLLAFLLAATPTLMVLLLDLERNTAQLDMIRYLLAGAPGMYLLIAATCTVGHRWLRHLPVAAVLMCTTALPWAYDVQEKQEFPAMVEAYDQNSAPGSTVVFVGVNGQPILSANLYLYFRYNTKNPPAHIVLLSGHAADATLIASLRASGPVWLFTRDGHPTPAMLPGYYDDPRWRSPWPSLRALCMGEQLWAMQHQR